VGSRSETIFLVEPRFQKEIRGFGPSVAAKIMGDIRDFQDVWQRGATDDELYALYKFKPYRGVHRRYRLYQIYVGPNRRNLSYRAVVMFYYDGQRACWINAFKKQRQSEPDEVNLAIVRADAYWDTIEGER
jgi:hypothetical protein